MKKSIAIALAATLLSVTCVFAQQEGEKTQTAEPPWIDMVNCEICQSFAFMEKEMANIKWETYIIGNGLMSISVMPEGLKEPMVKAKKEMEKTISRIESGENVKCCSFCQSMGSMMGQGAKMEEISTIAGDVQLITSDDPKVVEQIHAHAKKTMEYHNKKLKELHEHAGHDNDGKGHHDKDGHEHDNDGAHSDSKAGKGG